MTHHFLVVHPGMVSLVLGLVSKGYSYRSATMGSTRMARLAGK
jgi:hypothetical protein